MICSVRRSAADAHPFCSTLFLCRLFRTVEPLAAPLFLQIILNCRVQGISRQVRAVHLHRRQPFEVLSDVISRYLQCLFNRLSDCQIRLIITGIKAAFL